VVTSRVVVMGVAGSGKSTIGRAAAQLLEWPFVDADDLHSADDRAAMAAGHPLHDEQRDPWIERVCDAMEQQPELVVACSALRRRHRDRIRSVGAVEMYFLDVPADELARRLGARPTHFFPANLLDSQLAALEPVQPDEAVVVVDGNRPVVVVAADIVAQVGSRPGRERVDVGARARAVLEANRRGTWTCPSSTLYPHQWLWDSCFIAIGLAHSDPERAAGELRSLFRGQWANGMLPHMIFAEGVKDVGSSRIWQSERNPLAPRDVRTSCITQPPLVAIAVQRVAAALPPAEARAFLSELLPKLTAYHSWLYAERDPQQRGLVTLIHPWECGLDTSPPWMHALARMPMPWWLRVASALRLARILRRLRYDTRQLPAAERSSDDDGLRMLALAVLLRKHRFDLRHLPPRRAVLIEDLAFNALLVVANRALEAIAAVLAEDLPGALVARFRSAESALETLWDEDAGQYFSRDAITGAFIERPTIATFFPLWSRTAPASHVARLVQRLRDPAQYWPPHPVPSVPLDAAQFEETRYWKGPTWANANWIIIQGLRAHGETELAALLRAETVELIDDAACFEYFSPITGEGHGARDFSWTAALTLDLLDA
jgi:carbohydrate kinase (thermoresistant glucokinase family)